MPAIFVLTPQAIQQNLQNDGLDALGLTSLALSPRWGGGAGAAFQNYSETDLTIDLVNGNLRAPYRGLLEGAFAPATTTLDADLTPGATTLTVKDTSAFPSPQSPDSILLTLSSAGSSNLEIVTCTGVTGQQTMNITRGMNGSAAQAFSTGDTVSLRVDRGRRAAQFSRPDGTPMDKHCAVFRLHPEAVQRLEQLVAVRYQAQDRPVPWCMLVHNLVHLKTDQWYEADDDIFKQPPFTISFHDGRGLIVDPIYVASLFEDLLAWLPALKPASITSDLVTDAGGLHGIAQIKNTTLIHVVDPHGAAFQPIDAQVRLITTDSNGNPKAEIPASGLVTLANATDQIRAATTDAGRMRWGWGTSGILNRTPLSQPALPQPPPAQPNQPQPVPLQLNRQFLRVCAVDIEWYLRGNRTAGEVGGVPKDDGRIPSDLLPDVRDQVNIEYLVDGPDTLAEATRLIQLQDATTFLVSPILDTTLITPAVTGASAHWPAYPAFQPPAPTPMPNAIPQGGVQAAFMANNDVVVTLGTWVPDTAHVRIYPRQFQVIEAIGPDPSFLRGDGGANIATPNGASVWLANPFGLAANQIPPSPAVLTMDIVITDRAGARRTFGNVNVTLTAGQAQPPGAPWTGVGTLATIAAIVEGVGPSPLFGIPIPAPPAPPPPPPGATNLLNLILSKIAEPSPRQAPRLPLMARFETVVASGIAGGKPANSLLWEAVITGARWTGESLSAQHNLGNPGNPPGPDVHAAGIHVTGALAYDAALVALHRVQPLYPWPGLTTNPNPGWLMLTSGDNFDVPDDSANTTLTGAGVLLRTIAAKCETSQLADLTPPPANYSLNTMLQNMANAMTGATLPNPGLTWNNEPRLQREVRREFFVATCGLRDVQWALRRAILQARELIYIESPQFSRTAHPTGPVQDYEVDLVAAIVSRLQSRPDLKVIVCTPRLSDFAPHYANFARQHYGARTDAASLLLTAASDRVAIFHPVGFPGRGALMSTTSVVVDDVWALVGASHFRRRGMTFDGSVAVASFDRQMDDGYSKKVRAFRRAAMAARLRVPIPSNNQPPTGEWVRLARPAGAFALVADLLAEGGLGRIEPLWPGPYDPGPNNIIPEDVASADPEGSVDDQFMTLFSGVLEAMD